MANSIEDAEFWLPSEFLSEEDFFTDRESLRKNSAFSSPVESIAGSTETENSENKYWNMASSPQSTLCGGFQSLNGSPNGPSQVSSPPTTPFGVKNDTWDLIYAAAGQVARLKMIALYEAHQRSVALARNQNQNYNLQFQQVRQSHVYQTQGHQQIVNRGRAVGHESARCGHLHPAWPTLHGQNQQPQQVHGGANGMRAAVLGSDVKKKSTGTGVFLPRRYGNPVESRKKSGCSTVLIPPKVVQALNLNFDEMNGHAQPRFNPVGAYSQIHVDGMMAKSKGILTQQRRGLRHEGPLNHELRLPQEWTY